MSKLSNNIKKAEHYYIRAKGYGKHSRFASGIVLQSLCALKKYEEALNIVLGSTCPGKNWLAFLYEKGVTSWHSFSYYHFSTLYVGHT